MENLNYKSMTPDPDQLKKIRLVVSDMDGTLLNGKSQLPAGFSELIQKLAEKDVMFATASGRNWESQKAFFPDCREQLTFVCDNGAFIMYKGKPFFISELNADLWRAVAQKCSFYGPECGAIVCGVKGTYMIQNSLIQPAVSHFYSEIQYVHDFDAVEDQIFKVSVCNLQGTEGAFFDEFQRCFSDRASLVCAHPLFMDVMNPGINKATGVQLIQEFLGLSAEQTMVFGDYNNDIEMLKNAGISYVMENAPVSMRKYADFRAPSNEKNGVMTVLKETLLPCR